MLDEVFGSSFNDDMLNASSATLKPSILADIMATHQKIKARKQSIVIVRTLLKAKRDKTMKLMKALTKWKETSLSHLVHEVL